MPRKKKRDVKGAFGADTKLKSASDMVPRRDAPWPAHRVKRAEDVPLLLQNNSSSLHHGDPRILSVGANVLTVANLREVVVQAVKQSFDFVAVYLVHPRARRDRISHGRRTVPLTRSDMQFDSEEFAQAMVMASGMNQLHNKEGGSAAALASVASTWSTRVVGKISPWIRLDSLLESLRDASAFAFDQEVDWAAHLALSAVWITSNSITPGYSESWPSVSLTARAVLRSLKLHPALNIWISIDAVAETDQEGVAGHRNGRRAQGASSWFAWNALACMCEFAKGVQVALKLSKSVPTVSMQERWCAEPLACIVISTDLFCVSRPGYPYLFLTDEQELFLFRLFRHTTRVIVTGVAEIGAGGYAPYYSALLLHFERRPPLLPLEIREWPFRDYLQYPLQPLGDNLPSMTYATFEKDPVKYRQYYLAICAALEDLFPVARKRVDKGHLEDLPVPIYGTAKARQHVAWTADSCVAVVFVVGAGRGPLVRAALKAAFDTLRRIRVFAVEKNANAIVTLSNASLTEWCNDDVTIVHSDMREWVIDPGNKADIVISELLGSFADNELSPECLDGVLTKMKEGAISIPCLTTSYLAPISSSKLWSDVAMSGRPGAFGTAYVTKVHAAFELAPPQKCFVFRHPNPPECPPFKGREEECVSAKNTQVLSSATFKRHACIDNTRYSRLSFDVSSAAMVHGFVGYFEAHLYGDISISILPETFTKGMFSWFPCFFPLRQPVALLRVFRGEGDGLRQPSSLSLSHVANGATAKSASDSGSDAAAAVSSVAAAVMTLVVDFWRCSDPQGVWYEWCVSAPCPTAIHNSMGLDSKISLH